VSTLNPTGKPQEFKFDKVPIPMKKKPVPKKKAAPKKPGLIKVLPKTFTFMPTAKAANARMKRLEIIRKKLINKNGTHWSTPEWTNIEALIREQQTLLNALKKGPKAQTEDWNFIEEVGFDD
jgi:hypothetical protein